MMKLDAKIISYLAGDSVSSSEEQLALKCLKNNSPIEALVGKIVNDRIPAQLLPVFKSICGIKLQVEALTLQPEGTKRMELLQNEIRPIFTVECQLSNELIKNVPHYDMFNIMQFESEKFQSLTQCTRFGQEAQRDVQFILDDNEDQLDQNFGRINFTVWWREPGTCLNEILGIGALDLRDMYNASLLEQCKCIAINRRKTQLASLYLKISLKLNHNEMLKYNEQDFQVAFKMNSFKQCGGDSDEDKSKDEDHQSKERNINTISHFQNRGNVSSAEEANSASIENNNFHIQSTDFTNETSKVRLLKGFICANETRNLELSTGFEYLLVCRRFWQEDVTTTVAQDGINFNYQEQFAVINDEKFLTRADKQHLILEVWQRLLQTADFSSDHGITPVGIVRLPLHQFFIAYRDSEITNHLCNGKLPVISYDAWAPISTGRKQGSVGEIKCLLAIGSEEQITNLKKTRGFEINAGITINSISNKSLLEALNCEHRTSNVSKVLNFKVNQVSAASSPIVKNTTDLLDMLQKTLLNQSPGDRSTTDMLQAHASTSTGAVGASAVNSLHQRNAQTFNFMLYIERATGLPLNPLGKCKKGSKRNSNAITLRRFPPNEPPSTYVTFQAAEGYGKMYKSHEGIVYATNIVEKSTQPEWKCSFHVTTSTEYLTNARKRFILKVWKKANIQSQSSKCNLQPAPLEDSIIGFSAIDLTTLSQVSHIKGWYNVVDFNGRMNGQLELKCKTLDNLQQPTTPQLASDEINKNIPVKASVDSVIDHLENSLDLAHLNLGQAIKRKFTELEEISQRLRTRLVNVTGEEISCNFDISTLEDWESLETVFDNDKLLAEFERDITTPPPLTTSNAEVNSLQPQYKETNTKNNSNK